MVVNTPDAGPGVPQIVVPPRPPNWPLRVVLGLVAVVALGAGGWYAHERLVVRCADGVRTVGEADECVGLTDGGYVYGPYLEEVSEEILAENRRVEESGEDWVAVAYIEPMTLGKGDKGQASIRQELEGAALAQRALNGFGTQSGQQPRIKLLLGNTGAGSRQWRHVTDQVVAWSKDDARRVVAVAGLGQSRATTRAAVDALREARIPMMGSTVTADDLSEGTEQGFFRAVAPNADQASAVARYLAQRQREADGGKDDFTVKVVEDTNTSDIYSRSLLTGFRKAAGRVGLDIDPARIVFQSDGDVTGYALQGVADRVCRDGPVPDAVYFAGRGRDLKGFIEQAGELGGRCEVTVYTGDDAVGMFFDAPPEDAKTTDVFRTAWERGGVRVHYTALAHPDAPADLYPDSDGGPFPAFLAAHRETFGTGTDLLNGQTMAGHDALTVLGRAIRRAAGGGADTATPRGVTEMLLQTSDSDRVDGVTGPIDFGDDGDPRGKPLPLVELRPDEGAEYRYLRLVTP